MAVVHVVLLRLRADADAPALLAALAGLRGVIPGLASFHGGPYSSPECLNAGFTHGFTMHFESATARDAYLPHPAHEAVKRDILAALDGDGAVIAFDYAL
jgi:hypothetical protein